MQSLFIKRLKSQSILPLSSRNDDHIHLVPHIQSQHLNLSVSAILTSTGKSFSMNISQLKMSADVAGKDCIGWAAKDSTGILSPHHFKRRCVASDDVVVKITHCGVCYGDVIAVQNKFGHAKYPFVPGHEMVGIVKEVGDNVTSFKAGDHVGVGTYVNSCRNCEDCHLDLQVQCSKAVYTYNAVDVDGSITQGGYSSFIVVHQGYCFRIADEYPLEVAAPLLCAGITVYTPMVHHKMNQPSKSLGVVGLGGLGHMAVKFGKAFGLSVTVFSTSPSKKEEALNLLGADKFVLSTDEQLMKDSKKSLDFIIDTASGDHSLDQYVTLLKTTGVLALVGFPAPEIKLKPFNLILGMRSVSGSATGGLKRTQEMLDFCAAHKIYPEVEIIQIRNINEALERLKKNDVRYRFVIDIHNSLYSN